MGEVQLTAGFAPKDQGGAWQLISVDIHRQCSSDISVIVENFWNLFACAHICPSFSPSKRSPTWSCMDRCVMKANLGSPCCWFRISFAKFRDRGGSKRDVQPYLWSFCYVCVRSGLRSAQTHSIQSILKKSHPVPDLPKILRTNCTSRHPQTKTQTKTFESQTNNFICKPKHQHF